MDQKSVFRRVGGLIVISLVVLGVIVLRLVEFQLVNGEEYKNQAQSVTNYKFNIPAARGEIVDRYGRALASNAVGYDLVINQLMLTGDVNELVMDLVEILQSCGEEWNDTMPVSSPDESGRYTFTDGDDTSAQNRLAKLKENIELQQYATADQVMAKLVERYKLEDYDPQWQRILAGVRYQMQLEDFSASNSFTLASDVSNQTVAMVKERSLSLAGAEIIETTHRVYEDGTLLPHYLGSVGSITSEQWWVEDEDGNVTTPLKDAGYNMNDLIGQSGVEKYAEDRLRGKEGTQQVSRDKNGVVVGTQMLVEPEPGETVVLTIDKDLQKSLNEQLEALILEMQQTKPEMKGKEVTAGSAVVIDVKTGGVLAIANYPSYDLNLYKSNYSEYSSDPNTPLLSRATTGLYAPGSTFKPAVALAGLLNGIITPLDTVTCNHTYTFYTDYQPRCEMINHSTGSKIDVSHALTYSCNTFFYDVGRRMGIDAYDEMATQLGLAQKTGFELGESTGNLTYKTDENYGNGLELQAAIGQGNTQVTPIQLASYANTLANKGTRYKTHIISGYRDSNTGELIEEVEPEILGQIEDEIGAFDVVEEGMLGAARASSALKDYPLNIAVKTGSPQTWKKNGDTYYVHSSAIAYGPVEDPQLAIGIVLEWGGGGSNALPLVRSIFDSYYYTQSEGLEPESEGVLLP